MKSKLFFLLSVLLMTSCQKSLIAIDGDFDDWNAVPAGRLVQISANENARYNDLYSAKLCADAQNLYFYFEFNGEKGVFNVEGKDTTLNQIEWFDIFLDVDGDQASGFNCWNFKNAGADLLIEGRWSQKFAYAQLHHFPANANQDDWAWEDTKIKAFVTSCDAVTLDNGHKAIEGKINMKQFPVPVQSLKAGIVCSTIEWAELGILPQVTINHDGTDSMSELVEVPLPAENAK